MEECDNFGSFFSVNGSLDYSENNMEDDNGIEKIDDLQNTSQSPNPQVSDEGKSIQNGKPTAMFSSTCLEILKCRGRFSKKPRDVNSNSLSNNLDASNTQVSSLAEILKLAAESYVEFFTQRMDGFSMSIHPYGSASISGLSLDEMRDVELLHLLFAAGEEVSCGQYELASSFISRSLWAASDSGNPVQRFAFQFAEALKEKVDRETWRFIGMSEDRLARCQQSMALSANPTALSSYQKLPFGQVMQFSGMQAIIENVKSARKIHMVDFNIRSGVHWTVLMQALHAELHDCPDDVAIDLIKITAVGVLEREKMEECGNRLQSFADSLSLPFSFDIVFLADLKDFREDLVNVEAEEVVAVFTNIVLRTMVPRPDCLDSLMRGIRGLRPTVIVVAEVEANHNSPSFIVRFVEALFFFGAYFDCLEDCLEREDPNRRTMEGLHFGEGIRNVVATEGEDRFNRSVKIDVWRSYFARFGMEEIQLSESSLYQANLVLKQFASGNSCTLDTSGKGLIIGWKGTPLHSLTTWKFSGN